jgi:hypothetical protein
MPRDERIDIQRGDAMRNGPSGFSKVVARIACAIVLGGLFGLLWWQFAETIKESRLIGERIPPYRPGHWGDFIVDSEELEPTGTSEDALRRVIGEQAKAGQVDSALRTIERIKVEDAKDKLRLHLIGQTIARRMREFFGDHPPVLIPAPGAEEEAKARQKKKEEEMRKNRACLAMLFKVEDSMRDNFYKAQALRQIATFQRKFDENAAAETLEQAASLATEARWITAEQPWWKTFGPPILIGVIVGILLDPKKPAGWLEAFMWLRRKQPKKLSPEVLERAAAPELTAATKLAEALAPKNGEPAAG